MVSDAGGKSPLWGGEGKPVRLAVLFSQLPTVPAAVHFGDGRDETVALGTALHHPLFCH